MLQAKSKFHLEFKCMRATKKMQNEENNDWEIVLTNIKDYYKTPII